jgi:hypothetical protein
MRRIWGCILILVAACGSDPGTLEYQADGSSPDWYLIIGSNAIRLMLRHAERRLFPDEAWVFPNTGRVTSGAKQIWRSSASGRRIMIQAEFVPNSPCSSRGGQDTVRIALGRREFLGCGAPPRL